MSTATDLSASLGVDVDTLRRYAEAVADRVERGMDTESAMLDYHATHARMTEQALQARSAWHDDRQHGTSSQLGDAYKAFLLDVIQELQARQ